MHSNDGSDNPARPGDINPGDLALLEQLRSMGADLSELRVVDHLILAPSRSRAKAIAAETTSLGFPTKIFRTSRWSRRSWRVECSIPTVLSEDAVRERTSYFEDLAARQIGVYDGWGTHA